MKRPVKFTSNLKMGHKGLLLVAVPLAFELIFVGALVILLQQAQSEINRAIRSKSIIIHASALLAAKDDATTETVKLWFSPTGNTDTDAINELRQSGKTIERESQILKTLVEDHPDEVAQLIKVEQLVTFTHRLLEKERELTSDPNVDPDRKQQVWYLFNRKGIEAADKLRILMNEFLRTQRKVETESPAIQERNRTLIEAVLLFGVMLNIALCIILSVYFSRHIVGRLLLMNENVRRIAKQQPLLEVVSGADEIAQLDAAFHDMANQLQEVDRLKREFQAMLTHDLRSPLSVVSGTLDVLATGALGELSEKARNLTTKAKISSDYMLGLVNDMLDLSKLESHGLPLEYMQVMTAPLLENSIETVRLLADKKSIVIECTCPNETITADGARLTRVLVNLLSNAIKFSDKSSQISVAAKIAEGFFSVQVTDSGRGIPEADQKRIFSKFEQVKASDATLLGGTGLGLSICKAIAEAHGGSIGVQSEQGKGSTFWFKIPTRAGGSKNSDLPQA